MGEVNDERRKGRKKKWRRENRKDRKQNVETM